MEVCLLDGFDSSQLEIVKAEVARFERLKADSEYPDRMSVPSITYVDGVPKAVVERAIDGRSLRAILEDWKKRFPASQEVEDTVDQLCKCAIAIENGIHGDISASSFTKTKNGFVIHSFPIASIREPTGMYKQFSQATQLMAAGQFIEMMEKVDMRGFTSVIQECLTLFSPTHGFDPKRAKSYVEDLEHPRFVAKARLPVGPLNFLTSNDTIPAFTVGKVGRALQATLARKANGDGGWGVDFTALHSDILNLEARLRSSRLLSLFQPLLRLGYLDAESVSNAQLDQCFGEKDARTLREVLVDTGSKSLMGEGSKKLDPTTVKKASACPVADIVNGGEQDLKGPPSEPAQSSSDEKEVQNNSTSEVEERPMKRRRMTIDFILSGHDNDEPETATIDEACRSNLKRAKDVISDKARSIVGKADKLELSYLFVAALNPGNSHSSNLVPLWRYLARSIGCEMKGLTHAEILSASISYLKSLVALEKDLRKDGEALAQSLGWQQNCPSINPWHRTSDYRNDHQ